MPQTLSKIVTVEVITCAGCGGAFGVEQHLLSILRENGKTFYCPKGCHNVYRESEADRLRKQLARTDEELSRERRYLARERAAHDQTTEQLKHTEHRRRAEKGQKTKLQKRIKNGLCPCCNEFVIELHSHMLTNHPEYREDPDDEPEAGG